MFEKTTPTTPPENEPSAQASGPLFFNVMPKYNSSSPQNPSGLKNLEASKLSDVSQSPAEMSRFQKFMALLKPYKVYIALVIALLILSPLVWWISQKIGSNSETENLLSENTLNTPLNQNSKVKNTAETASGTPLTAIAKEWQLKYFNDELCKNPELCGDGADPDFDGLTNLEEYKKSTDPNNPDSDKDGLSDGDEVNVFSGNPLDSHTAKNPKYSDKDSTLFSFSLVTDKKYTTAELSVIKGKIKEFGLHSPTQDSLGDVLLTTYEFSDPKYPIVPKKTATSTPEGFDDSVESKQDRDAQRSSVIKTVGIALVRFYEDNKSFPKTSDFKEMYTQIKPYVKTATNPQDPINQGVFVYSYNISEDGKDYTLSFFSESVSQAIKKHFADAQKDKIQEEGDIFDNLRRTDLETLRSALLIYSAKNLPSSSASDFVFPQTGKLQSALVPDFISALPKDPKTQKEYEYKAGEKFDTFTLKSFFDNPKSGTTGYMCNQEECTEY